MTISFGDICSLLQSVEDISTQQSRWLPGRELEEQKNVVSNWFNEHRDALDVPDTNGGAVLSALLPHRRKDRVYGLQAPRLAKKVSSLLGFNHRQKTLFEDWKTGKLGDLGIYTEQAMKPWDGTFTSKRTIPIERVDRLLVQLAAKFRFSDEAIRKQRIPHADTDTELKDILVRLESWEAKWLVRLLLREYSTIELHENHIFKCYHFLLPDLLKFQSDFEAAFNMLHTQLSNYPAAPDSTLKKPLRIAAAQKLKPVVGTKVGRPVFYKAWSFKHCFQMTGDRAWSAETKYDGEYCEIHVDLARSPQNIKIFSKNGKDATTDRAPLHANIQNALRVGRPNCLFKSNCIVLGEMVLYSDREKKILPFSKIRKHVSRSGSFLGNWQDSNPHEWEHLMIVFFDVLVIDNDPVLRHCLQDRRKILRDLVQVIPGRSMRSEWTLLDFKTRAGIIDLKQVFARTLANRQEGIILKPLHAPYFSLLTDQGDCKAGYFIKVKKDYLADMGGERDLGDFAIIGASFDAQIAPKADIKPLHWTHFYLACCTNKPAVQRTAAKPKFKVLAILSLDHKCISKSDVRYLNVQGYVRQMPLGKSAQPDVFDIEHVRTLHRRMTIAFKHPFVAEVLGGGFETLPNEKLEMLRHPRVTKIHHDRTWEDCVTLDELQHMAGEQWDVPNADHLDGHARDVADLVKKYVKDIYGSQISSTAEDTTQETTQRSEEITPLKTIDIDLAFPNDAVVQETQQNSHTSTSSLLTPESTTYITSRKTALKRPAILVREDTSELLTNHLDLPSSSSSALYQQTIESTSRQNSSTSKTTVYTPPTKHIPPPKTNIPNIPPPTIYPPLDRQLQALPLHPSPTVP